MQANVESLGTLERRLSVSVPMTQIETEVEQRLKHLTRTVKLAGFRPGKVPMKVVARQYGPQVRQEVLGDTLQKSFGDAVRQQNLRVAGYPKFEAKPVDDGAAAFEFSATFEVYPEIAVGDISGKTIGRPVISVGEAEVDKTIAVMRKQRTRFEPVERAAATGDRLRIDFSGTIDGAPFNGSTAKDFGVLLGEGRMLPDFEKQLDGLKAGDRKTFDVKFPDDYHGKDVAGKTASFDVTVSEVGAPRLPELDAEFAKALGVPDGDLVKMRAEVRANLEREVNARLKARTKDQVIQVLLESTRVEAPRALVDMEIGRMQQMARQDMAARGMPVKDDTPLPADIFREQAARRVTLGLIFAEVVRVHDLGARAEQVKSVVEDQAQSYEHPQEVVKWFYQSPERLREIESTVLEQNVVDWALRTAKVEDKAIVFDELMGTNA